MKTISFLNLKGGVGKTTSANNLAVGLAKKGHQVLLIDFDQQGNTSDIFYGKEVEKGIAWLLTNPQYVNDEITETEVPGLDLIPSSLDLAIAERTLLVSSVANHNKLQKVFRYIKKDYDYCIIDCPPVLNLLVTNALIVSNEVIIPIKIDRGALKGYQTTISQLHIIQEEFNLNIHTSVMFTMVNRNNTDRAVMDNFKNINVDVIQTTIRQQAKPITQASFERKVVITTNSPVGCDYQDMVDEFIRGQHCPLERSV